MDTLRGPPRPRRHPIGILGHLLLIPIVAVLAIIAAVVGWSALHPAPAPAAIHAIGGARQPEWPAPLAPEIRSLPPVTGVPVEAAARRPSPAERVPGAPLRVNLEGQAGHDDLEVVVFDALTGVERASQPVGGEPAIRFGDLPAGDMIVALRQPGRSARFESLTTAAVTVPDTGASGVSVTLPIATHSVSVALTLIRATDDENVGCAAISVTVRRPDDPAWCGPTATAACPGAGTEPVTLELGPLGAGRYRLDLTGMITSPDADLTFELPRQTPVVVEGRQRQ